MNDLELIKRYIEAYNTFDIETMMSTLHPDIAFQNISNGEINAETHGMEAFRTLAEQSKGLFASRKQTITNVETNESQTRIDVTFEAILAVDLPNGLKAGELLQLQGNSEFTFRDGKIVSIVDRA
ncbi:nuclear transport factor 2 family protein [Sulfurospirillum sp. hDNRA2]|uniref:nuclear transport factor 2 family protein n=1 Tax=Sulfurospirillum sp. hDNRA2 TaxID=3237298 RepID=UPI0020B8F502|nr:nuclear transport factor 2 family protein [Sulfurospirillum sp. DNRA8]MCP3652025.1 nuclear transport factor 2 family protein [Sulfurospirillum sp. DNRA8]MCR1810873.1 nuclear transport factor 2 family protein [Sulfurospirillum sp. DNRA8]